MRKTLFSLLFILTCFSAQAQKQGAKQPEIPPITVEEAIGNYDFHMAESLLNQQLATLKKKKQPTLEVEEKLAWLRKAQIKLNAVERTVFIDSLVVPRTEALKHIRLNAECGSLDTYAHYFQRPDSMGCTVFCPQMGDQVFYAKPNHEGYLNLYTCDLYSDGTSSQPRLLEGISNEEEHQNYPYMMTDGCTIYFAAQGTESLGGYDIFMSRYDADEHHFLMPENIGMPFNSPANDYLMAIDEINNLGWFVTDRNTSADSVCIYVFIPNETRQVYLAEEMEGDSLARLARIASISDTWVDEGMVRAAKARLRQVRAGQSNAASNEEFSLVITDNQVYHRTSDFKNMAAQQMVAQWMQSKNELQQVQEQLRQQRTAYHKATPIGRESLKQPILSLEQNEELLIKRIRQMENQMRKTELGL